MLVRDQLVEEAQVGAHAAHAEFPQRTMHAGDGLVGVGAHAVTFTSSESYERVMNAPEYAVPASSRCRNPRDCDTR
jgi:hypothetical protein